MFRRKSFFIFVIIIILCVISCNYIYKNREDIYINTVLLKQSYSYLSAEAKAYVKEVYEETGEVILTEKNKKENTPYLNPRYIEYLSYSDSEKDELGEIPVSMIVDYSINDTYELSPYPSYPSSYDLRDANGKNYITPVRDQGDLGLCWAFATAGAVESYLLKNNNLSYTSSSQLISERQIDYITARNGISDYKSEYVSFINRNLGAGGNFYISTIAMANGVSLIDYNSFKKYNDRDLNKMELYEVISYDNSLYEVDSTINLPILDLRESTDILTDEEQKIRTSYLNEIKYNVMENGAAYVGTYMNSKCQYVDSGLNNVVIDVYGCSANSGHAMEIIGWDDNLEYSYCADTLVHNSDTSNCKNVVSGKGVWILKNSYGDNIQYPYLAYDSLYSSFHFITEIESNSDKNWDNNYVFGSESANMKEKTYYLTNTRIKDEEKIKKIKFITESPDAEYTVKIYNNDTFASFSKKTDLPGLITIDIDEDVIINKDTKITIISDGSYIDKVSIFTLNIDKTPYINLDEYKDKVIYEDEIRLYSETKNILSGSELVYKLYDLDNKDVSSKITVTNNIVAENNINTLIKFSNELDSGNYRLDVIYNSNVISSVEIEKVMMEGSGTESDPYVITNSIQLDQIRNDLDAHYVLGNDIDLTNDTREGGKLSHVSEICEQPFGWKSINDFSGTLDGKGYTIKGLYQNNYISCGEGYDKTRNGNGLFGKSFGNVTIKNLVLDSFDITCFEHSCGALVSDYDALYHDESYNAVFENIAIKNSKVAGVDAYGGGLFGGISSYSGEVSISNIFLDIDIDVKDISMSAYLVYFASAKKGLTIKNIQVLGNLDGRYESGSDNSVLSSEIFINDFVEVKNILSTVTGTNLSPFGTIWENSAGLAGNLTIDGVNFLKTPNKELFYRFDKQENANILNINLYDSDSQLVEMTKKSNYSTWENFDDNWVIKTVDGVDRIPVLKFVDFEYTNIPDISIKQKLNEHVSIYDYLTPKIEAAKRISYKSNDESIVKIDESGTIIPQATGNATIHVESFYDGYIKDVPISIEYVPHYTISFDANSGIGTMDTVEVAVENNYTLPANKFTKEHYDFKGWNTKVDGTGVSYSDLAQINAMNDKETITLYAQWLGEEMVVTFNADGGIVTPTSKIVHYGDTYGDLPIPIRDGYGFCYWVDGNMIIESDNNIIGLDLVAFWEENAYTIAFDANGGVLDDSYDRSLPKLSNKLVSTYALFDKDKELDENKFIKEGYKFKEWNTKADGTGTSYTDKDVINFGDVENSLLTLYAIWEQNTGKITYYSNDESNLTIDQDFTYDVDTKLNKNTFTREGHEFKGWNTKTDGTGTPYTEEQLIKVSSDLVLYAQWEKIKYTLKFDANGGSGTMNEQVFVYDTLQKLTKNIFTKDGYKFKEWNTKKDGTGTSYTDEKEIKLSENLTIYAIWEETYSYKINKYLVDESEKYIDLIDVNTSVDEFKKNIELNDGFTVKVDYETINGKNLLYTGGKTKIYKDNELYVEYTNIIRGDVNGNATIDIIDYIRIMKDIMDNTKLNGVYKRAADVNQNDKIDIIDYIRIMKMIMEEN